jgi:hypothetical protein
MRIVIESSEIESSAIAAQGPTPPAPFGALSGGAPAEPLAGVSPTPALGAEASAVDATNAGPPPEWLLQAIRDSHAPSEGAAPAATNAGPAPAG